MSAPCKDLSRAIDSHETTIARTGQAAAKHATGTLHQVLASSEYGGGEEIALELAVRYFNSTANTVQIWAPGRGRAAERAASLGLRVETFDMDGLFSRWTPTAALASLTSAVKIRRRGPGIVHVHSPIVYGAMRHALQVTGSKRIVHVHLEYPLDTLRWAFRSPPELIITCARFLEGQVRSALPAAFRESQRIVAVPNAVDLEKFSAGEKPRCKRHVGAPINRPLILMLANLSPHKGQETTIRAVAELKRRGRPVSCWLAGVDRSLGKSYELALRRLIDESDVAENVSLLGFRNDAADLLRAADIVTLPSTNEGLPLTLLEAQASRVPVIAAPTAGVPEIISDGQTGFLVAAGDAAVYANRMESLLDDSRLYRHITEQAERQCRSKHSWENYYQQVAALYNGLQRC